MGETGETYIPIQTIHAVIPRSHDSSCRGALTWALQRERVSLLA